ncbi:hypothetical protein SteCoe_36791 [Stentor coeruleus]|uniref:VPS9 domain-containing protein n=1 Tax=Stentor coeruleus TaxID=5963 RepID=A0A1R2APC1_9CILI|nr:hypothetical protein SteCoe_36791 [Stentor coeruleus]
MDRSTVARPESEIESSIVSEQGRIDKSLELHYLPGTSKLSPREIGKSRVRLPCFKVVLPLSVSTSFLFDIFLTSCNKYKFLVSEQSSSSITAIQTLTSTMRNLFTCLLPISEEKKARTSSIVRIDVTVNEKNCARVVTVRGMYGFPNRICQVIQVFKDLLEKAGTEFVKENKEDSDLAMPTFQTAYYQVSRFLSNNEAPAGKLYSAFIEEFWGKYTDIPLAAQNTKAMVNFIKNSIDGINDLINKTVSQYSRLAIEKYIFTKIFAHVKKIYIEKKSEVTTRFLSKRSENQTKTDEELMQQLDVKEKFCIKGVKNPYFSAIESLNNLDKHSCPIDKLNCILESTTHMKTTVIDYWRGREELETMDDQLPVIIFIVCKTSLDNFPAQIEFLTDYTRVNTGMDNENRLLINYDAAISFILSDM